MASLVEEVTRHFFSVAERIAPKKTRKLAFRLFCMTPSRKPANAKAKAMFEAAAPRMAGAETRMLAIQDGAVATHLFAPSGSGDGERVLVVHGWGSRTEYMLAIVDALTAAGKTVVALDQPGHGGSTGRQLHLGLAVQAVDAAWREYGPFDAMIGHSFGGPTVVAAAAGAVSCVPARVPEKLILISAPDALAPVFEHYMDRLRFPPSLRAGIEHEVLMASGRPLRSWVVQRHLARVRADVLAIHAHDDKEVPAACAEALKDAGSHVQVMWADGFGHRRIVSAPPVLDAITRFLGPEPLTQAA